jgi:hypothetical protein
MGSLLLNVVGESNDVGGQTPLAGLEDPALRVSEAGEVERQELGERALGLVEARLERAGRGPEGRDDRIAGGGHCAARIAQQRLAGGGVGRDAPGGEEGLGLARASRAG